jgi:hypothetical protein
MLVYVALIEQDWQVQVHTNVLCVDIDQTTVYKKLGALKAQRAHSAARSLAPNMYLGVCLKCQNLYISIGTDIYGSVLIYRED